MTFKANDLVTWTTNPEWGESARPTTWVGKVLSTLRGADDVYYRIRIGPILATIAETRLSPYTPPRPNEIGEPSHEQA